MCPSGVSFSARAERSTVTTNGTILIVDDEDLLRWSLSQRFSSGGWTVHEAKSVAGAIDVLRRFPVELVLLDVRLPDGDGLSVLRLIKEEMPETLVVLMTAFSSISNAVEAMKEGAYYYLHKPFNLND